QSSRLLIKIVILLFEYLVSVLTGAYLSENPLVSIKRYTLYLTLYLGVKVTRWLSRIQSQDLISQVGYKCYALPVCVACLWLLYIASLYCGLTVDTVECVALCVCVFVCVCVCVCVCVTPECLCESRMSV